MTHDVIAAVLGRVFRAAADECDRVAAEQRQEVGGWVSQQGPSPFPPRLHCSVTRARLRRGEPGAAIIGRRHLLSAEALTEELQRRSARSDTKPKLATDVRSELERELRLVGSRR